MPITNLIRDNWRRFQGELFPEIQDAVGPLLKNHQRFVMALGIICPEDFTLRTSQRNGRHLCDRINLVRAFIAKAIWDIPTTRDLVERLKVDRQMRNLCCWVLIHEIPSESTFSRAFAEFAESDLPGRMHDVNQHSTVTHFPRPTVTHLQEGGQGGSRRRRASPAAAAPPLSREILPGGWRRH